MTLTSTGEIVAAARAAGQGVGALNVIQLEHAEAIAAGAETAKRPVLLQISENCVRYHGALRPLALASRAVAEAAAVPVGLHLDHAESEDLVQEAVALGFTSVMFDASQLDYRDNVERTTRVTSRCHEAGVFVEAELGEVGGKDGAHAPGVRTDPEEAALFVEATGVDALAVAVGTSHAMTSKDAALDYDLIAELQTAVPVPLVLHGSSGVSNEGLVRAIRSGMTKVNVATHFNVVFTSAARDYLAANPDVVDTRKYLGAARAAMADEVQQLLTLFAEARRGGRVS
ncbi:class II fructose-bisphosphate aldolase [Segeticoccus rhizosphaerae]|jgi:fructose-bisphosphate aldolase class II|uniref:class II fructose-bisphosphate aldolase n=1 Tax=Segeticoccus rhizosphaerae TaxID=1104777 RepID=UPI0010C05B86|nr:class II fructose-bisphosphate aldolase [Ornithinicoccus soli]